MDFERRDLNEQIIKLSQRQPERVNVELTQNLRRSTNNSVFTEDPRETCRLSVLAAVSGSTKEKTNGLFPQHFYYCVNVYGCGHVTFTIMYSACCFFVLWTEK